MFYKIKQQSAYIRCLHDKIKALEERNRELSYRVSLISEENRCLKKTFDNQTEGEKKLPVPEVSQINTVKKREPTYKGQKFDFDNYVYRMRLGDVEMGFEAIRRHPGLSLETNSVSGEPPEDIHTEYPQEDSLLGKAIDDFTDEFFKDYDNSNENDSLDLIKLLNLDF